MEKLSSHRGRKKRSTPKPDDLTRGKGEFLLRNRKRRPETGGRKAQVLQIATDIFYRDGYEKSSLREIAQKAAITKAAMYHYFVNKESLMLAILERLLETLRQVSEKEFETPYRNPCSAVRSLI